MKAPNGKQSKLDERQWVHVRTNAFKDFFGDWENDPENASKVVDENGEPLVVYHGSGEKAFNTFTQGDIGFHFGNYNQALQRNYMKVDHEGVIRKFYLNIKNPLTLEGDAGNWHGNKLAQYLLSDNSATDFGLERKGGKYVNPFTDETDIETLENIAAMKDTDASDKRMREFIEAKGYDGIRYANEVEVSPDGADNVYSYIAFHSDQIKSATDNVGTYDKRNNDVRYSLRSQSVEEVNDKFNQRLDELLADPTQKNRVLHLGYSSSFLKDGGVADAEILLEYDKITRKSSDGYKNEHPFDAVDLKNLPKSIHAPIAVFADTNDRNIDENADRNVGKEPDHVILTELQKGGHNFIVVVRTVAQPRKGGITLEVNSITTLFPKNARGIIYWLNKKKATNIDKKKALRFIEELRNHRETTITREELDDATKVVETFQNPPISNEESSSRYSLRQHNRQPGQMDTRAADLYEEMLRGRWSQIDEAWHDDLVSVRRLQEALEQATGRKVRDYENVYLNAVHKSSKNKVMMDRLIFDLVDPMIDAVKAITSKHLLDQDEVEQYLNCKHGLERNRVLAQRKADEAMANDEKRFVNLVAKYFAEQNFTPTNDHFKDAARAVAEQCAAQGMDAAQTHTQAVSAASAYVQGHILSL